jgi:hypothetical protein
LVHQPTQLGLRQYSRAQCLTSVHEACVFNVLQSIVYNYDATVSLIISDTWLCREGDSSRSQCHHTVELPVL